MVPSSFEPSDMRFPGFLWFEQCFAFAQTAVPKDIKAVASILCTKLEMSGLEQPLEVANIVGHALARGLGNGQFFARVRTSSAISVPEAAAVIARRMRPLVPAKNRHDLTEVVYRVVTGVMGFRSFHDLIPRVNTPFVPL